MGQRGQNVIELYRDTLPQCLEACNCSLQQLAIPLRKRVELGGDEKLRRADWLEYQMAGGVLTAKQIAEIRHATIKYRSHKIKHEEWQRKVTMPADMGTIPKLHTAPIAEGAGSSSSGNIYTPVPQRTHARPSDGQPTTPFVLPCGSIPVRGQAKRVREEGSITRTTGQAATDPLYR